MSCLYPVEFHVLFPALRGRDLPSVVHNLKKVCPKDRDKYFDSVRPCGSCIECRLSKSSFSAVRCVHEASMYQDNSFLTLTIDDDHFPDDHSLSSRTMQLFWKKLRRRTGAKFKYFAAGEYGEGEGERFRISPVTGLRVGDNPHYHACVFGFDFDDKVEDGKNELGDVLYRSKLLDSIWGLGRCILGAVTFESAAYCARYTLKKVYGDDAEAHYDGRLPERCWWSLGVGKSWFQKWHSDVYPSDKLVLHDGRVLSPPPYYDKLLLKHDPDLYGRVMDQRAGKIIIPKNNFELVRNHANGSRTMSVSEVVKRSSLRVGRLDHKR